MNKQDVSLLYKYNKWANAKIMEGAVNVTHEQFIANANFPHGGLRGTLVHTLFAEWIWRHRWEGTSPVVHLKSEDFPTFETLEHRWADEEDLLMRFIENVTDDMLNNYFFYTATDGSPYERVLWQTMLHLVNHGTQHRSEAAAMLTDFGHSPGDIDFVYFLSEM